MKLREIAERIAASEPGRDVEYVHSVLRNPRVKILLDGEAGRSRTSPGNYGPREIIRARILIAVHDAKLTVKEMEIVDQALRSPAGTFAPEPHPKSARLENGDVFYLNGLGTLIRGTQASEIWSIQLRIVATSDGQERVIPWVKWGGWEDTPNHDLLRLHGEHLRATIDLPVSEFIAPLLPVIAMLESDPA